MFLMSQKEWHDTVTTSLWSQWGIFSVRYCSGREFCEDVPDLLDLHVSVSFSSNDKSILCRKWSLRKNCCDENWPCFISGRLITALWVIRWEGPVNWCSVEQVTKNPEKKWLCLRNFFPLWSAALPLICGGLKIIRESQSAYNPGVHSITGFFPAHWKMLKITALDPLQSHFLCVTAFCQNSYIRGFNYIFTKGKTSNFKWQRKLASLYCPISMCHCSYPPLPLTNPGFR